MSAMAKQKGVAPRGASLAYNILAYGALAVLNALLLTLIYGFATMGNTSLVVVLGIIAIGTTVVFFVPQLYPIRWMVPGLAFVLLLVVYPIYFTVANSFTNFGDGHLFAKQQSIRLIEARRFVPPDGIIYRWEVMQAADGTYGLWLTREVNGQREVLFAPQGAPLETISDPPAEPPATHRDFRLLAGAERTAALQAIQNAVFGTGDDTVGIRNRREAARPLQQRYQYDPAADAITDQATGRVYVADNVRGLFVPQDGVGDPLAPGFIVGVGLANFARFINDPGLRGPLIDIFVWTVVFAAMSVITTFALGLLMAIILNSPDVVGRKVIQSLLIIPYAIPAVISIMVWRALLNDNFGLINRTLVDIGLLHRGIPFLSDGNWAKFSILLVNLWLGYPYMMLISSGALQAIPSDVYEAAAVDGATPWQSFQHITLPLLLITVGPLLVASFTFNFNNFLLIDALTQGNPPIPGSPVQAGYTDILISYTYRLAFGNRGADYGYASAITIIIFAMVALVTVLQTRLNNEWEKVSDNA